MRGEADPLARALEVGLFAVVLLGPLPFGAVTREGRLALEAGTFLLLAIWLARACLRSTPLPPRACRLGLLGLLLFGLIQAMPMGGTAASWLSPLSLEVRRESLAPGESLEAESRLLGVRPASLDSPLTLSLDPEATASSLRTGAALAALFLVATTVVATRGPRLLALALLSTAAFQGLYGTLVLASGVPRIWDVPKRYYLDCATGTFVNRNHFAGLLAAALPCGLALVVSSAQKLDTRGSLKQRLLGFLSVEGSRALLLGLLLAMGLSGLLLSFSRAGIAVGLSGLLLTALALGRHGLRRRVLVIALLAAMGLVPLAQIGAERLTRRYALASEDLTSPGGRSMVWRDTLGMIRASPLVGVGFGAFDSAYPLFRSPEVRLHYDHAHNDALQAAAEGGALGAALLLLVLYPVFGAIVRSLGGARGALPIGLGAGLGALLLHALVDFNFHIPSNAATAMILAGALLGLEAGPDHPWIART